MNDPFVLGVVSGALAMLMAVIVFRFARREGRDLSAPPRMAPPPARPAPTPEPLSPLEPGQRPEYDPRAVAAIADALNRGQKIEAIKHLREATGLGLAEAKTAVEDMERKLRG